MTVYVPAPEGKTVVVTVVAAAALAAPSAPFTSVLLSMVGTSKSRLLPSEKIYSRSPRWVSSCAAVVFSWRSGG